MVSNRRGAAWASVQQQSPARWRRAGQAAAPGLPAQVHAQPLPPLTRRSNLSGLGVEGGPLPDELAQMSKLITLKLDSNK